MKFLRIFCLISLASSLIHLFQSPDKAWAEACVGWLVAALLAEE